MLKPAVFLDRDGVLVEPVGQPPYAALRWEDFAIIPGAAEAVQRLHDAGFLTIVITNQPEVRRGNLDPGILDQFHERLRLIMPLDEVLVCCHDDRDHCDCRKPKPGLILDAARRHAIDLGRSYLIGDTDRDLGAAAAAGLTFILVDAPYNRQLHPEHRVPNTIEAATLITSLAGAQGPTCPVLS